MDYGDYQVKKLYKHNTRQNKEGVHDQVSLGVPVRFSRQLRWLPGQLVKVQILGEDRLVITKYKPEGIF